MMLRDNKGGTVTTTALFNLEEERARLFDEIARARADLDRREAALEKREAALQEEKAAHREQVREDRAQAREEAAVRREEAAQARLESERIRFEAAEARSRLEAELRSKLDLAQARLESELMLRAAAAGGARPPTAEHGSFNERRRSRDYSSSSHRASHEEPALDYMPVPPNSTMPPRENSYRGARRSGSNASVTKGGSERPAALSRRPTGVIVEEEVDGSAEAGLSDAVAAPSGAPPSISTDPAHASTLPPPGRYAAFVSHYKVESAMEARYVQNELEQKLGRQVFLDSDDLRDLRQLQEHVRESEVMILMQTPGVLTRPYCLLELYTAIMAGRPIVGVTVTGGSGGACYDFNAASELLHHLDTLLDGRNPGATAILEAEGVHVVDAAFALSTVVPKVISIQLNAYASRHHLSATMQELVEAIQAARPLPLPASRDMWMAARASTAATARGAANANARRLATTKPKGARVPLTVPALPAAFDASSSDGSTRAELLTTLKRELVPSLQGDGGGDAGGGGGASNKLSKVLLRGMGGVGKTCLCVAVARDAQVLAHYECLVWVTLGQQPDLEQHLRSIGHQLRASSEAEASTTRSEGGGGGAKTEQVKSLMCLDEHSGSACLLSSRVRGLVKVDAEVAVDVMRMDEAVGLLLSAGEVSLPAGAPPPPAAVEAAELCGRLPLTLGIAGAMLRELADDWESSLVSMLRSDGGAELRERSGGEAMSVEQRVISASLNMVAADERHGVISIFEIAATFGEDTKIPIAVFDALAPIVLQDADARAKAERAGGAASGAGGSHHAGGTAQPEFPTNAWDLAPPTARDCLRVRRYCLELLRLSLLQGTLSDGVQLHDLVRDFTIAQANQRRGGLPLLQQRVVGALMTSRPEAGFEDLLSESQIANCKGAELSFYVSHCLCVHIHGALAGANMLHIVSTAAASPRRDGGAAPPNSPLRRIVDLVAHKDTSIQRQAAWGLGQERISAAKTAAIDAGEFFLAAALAKATTELVEARQSVMAQGVIDALSLVLLVNPPTEESAALELQLLPTALIVTSAVPAQLEHHQQFQRRVLALVEESGGYDSLSLELLNAVRITYITKMMKHEGIFQGTAHLATPDDLRTANAARMEVIRVCRACVPKCRDDRTAIYYETMGCNGNVATAGRIAQLDGADDAFWEHYLGERGARAITLAEDYQFGKHHGYFKYTGTRMDPNLMAADAACLITIWGDLRNGREVLKKVLGRWAKAVATHEQTFNSNMGDWRLNYAFEWMLFRVCGRSGLVLLRDWQGLAESYEQFPDEIGESESGWWPALQQYAAEIYRSSPHQIHFMSAESAYAQMRAIRYLAHVSDESAEEVMTWLPSPTTLMAFHDKETQWDTNPAGGMHVALLCGHVYLTLGKVDEAKAIATGLLSGDPLPGAVLPRTKQALTRLEAQLLLATCYDLTNDARAMVAELESTASEAARVGYRLVEYIAMRRITEHAEADAASKAKAEAGVTRVLGRLVASRQELEALDVAAASKYRRPQ